MNTSVRSALDDTANVSITSEFMEDYHAGRPWLRSEALEEVYVSRDGTAQLLAIMRDSPIIVRMHPDPDSGTGWAAAAVPLPKPIGPARLPPRAMILPGPPDWLVIYRDCCVQVAMLADDGSFQFGEVSTIEKGYSIPLVHGQLPPGTQFIPELWLDSAGGAYDIRMRSINPLSHPWPTTKSYSIDAPFTAFPVSKNVPPRVFPLEGARKPGEYRCAVLQDDGTMIFAMLVLDETRGVFEQKKLKVVPDTIIPGFRSAKGCFYVDEIAVPPGRLRWGGEVAVRAISFGFFDTDDPRYPRHMPLMRTIGMNFDSIWDPEVTASGRLDDFPASFPDGTTFEITGLPFPVYPKLTFPSPEWGAQIYLSVKSPNPANAQFPELWSIAGAPSYSGMGVGDPWELYWKEPAALVDRGCHAIAGFASHPRKFCVFRPATGYEVWQRNANSDYDIDEVDVQAADAPIAETAGCRVGVVLTGDGLPLGGEEITVTASVSCAAIVGGRHCAIRNQIPLHATTDATGTLWLTVLMQDRLSFPTLTFASNRFERPYVADLDHGIRNYLANITSEQLEIAIDPRSGRKVLADTSHANAVADSIRSAMAAAPPRTRATRRPLPSWRLDVEEGVPRFTALQTNAAKEHMARLNASHPAVPALLTGVLDDFFDWVGDVAAAAWKGVVNVMEMVVDGVTITLKLLVDGVTYVYNGLMETIDQVMDAVTFVLNAVGTALGTAVGWLLDQLGFLFDWKATRVKRDELRDLLSRAVSPAMAKIKDPAISVTAFIMGLDGAKSEIIAWLRKFRSDAVSVKKFGTWNSSAPSLPSYFRFGSTSILPQATWLLDKLEGPFSRFTGDIGCPDVPGLDSALTRLATQLLSAGDALAPSLGDLQTLVDGWLADAKLFTGAAMDPIIDIVISHIDGLFAFLKDILTATADALHAVWANPEKVFAWFDSTLPIPFLAGFYKGLTGNNLSILDLICLAAAIPAVVLSETLQATAQIDEQSQRMEEMLATAAPSPPQPAPSKSAAWQAARHFMIFGCFTTMASGAASTMLPASDKRTDVLSVLDLATTLASTICIIVEKDELWEEIAVPLMVVGVGGVAAASPRFRRAIIEPALVTVMGVNLARMIGGVIKHDDNTASYAGLSVVQALFSLGARLATNRGTEPLSWQAAAGYGVAQGCLSGVKTWIFAQEPLGNP